MDLKFIAKPLFFLGFFDIFRKSLKALGNAIGNALGTPWRGLGDALGGLGDALGGLGDALGGLGGALEGPSWRTLGFSLRKPPWTT